MPLYFSVLSQLEIHIFIFLVEMRNDEAKSFFLANLFGIVLLEFENFDCDIQRVYFLCENKFRSMTAIHQRYMLR